MKWIVRFTLLIIVLFGAAMIAGAFKSDEMIVERSVIIDAEAPDIFVYMNDLSTFEDWSPWRALTVDGHVLGGPSYGEAQTLAWHSDDPMIGTGSQTIMESFQDSFVHFDLNIGGRVSLGTYALEPLDDGTTSALIAIESQLGGFPYIQRLFSGTYVSKTEAQFDDALALLKTQVEADVAAYEAMDNEF